jgi:hypothetical protein
MRITHLIALLTLSAHSYAQGNALPKPVAGMECLVGTWRGAGTLNMGKDKSNIDATWTCKRTSARYGVLCTFHVTGVPGVAAYDETDLMGYEPNTNTYHWYSVTNAGETHDHVAKATEGNSHQFTFNGTQEGKSLREVIDLSFASDNRSVSGRVETFIGGVSMSLMTLGLRK